MGTALYFGGNYLLNRFSEQALSYITAYIKTEGTDVTEPTFGSAYFSSWRSATWKNCAANFSSSKIQRRGQALQFSGHASAITLTMMSSAIEVKVDGASGGPTGNASHLDANRIDLDHLRTEIPLPTGNPEAMVRGLLRTAGELFRLLEDGKTTAMVEAGGKATFQLGDRIADLHFEIGKHGEYYSILMDRQDLEQISNMFTDPLTPSELDILAEYPVLAPKLFQIKQKAEQVSSSTHRSNPAIPEDAYRHVLWSYLLTKEYGPGFAEQVTNAHEVGSRTNTEADHRMDYNNNAVGRQYAAQGELEANILNRLLYDPAVIREPR